MQAETRCASTLQWLDFRGALPLAPAGHFASYPTMAHGPFELVLLDAAGTLIEPREPVETTYQDFFARHGWQVDVEQIRRGFHQTFATLGDPDFAGYPDGDSAERGWWREVVGRTAASAGIDRRRAAFETCFQGLFDHYASSAAWQVFPEIPEVLARLKSWGCKLAVVSNFDRRLHRVLAELDLADSFDLILTSADVGSRKPSPDLLNRALAGFPALRACHVGDSARADGGAADAAGVPVFLLDRPATTLLDFLRNFDSGNS